MRDCTLDLEKSGQLLRIKTPVDPNLEMAEIHRRVYDAGGPALLFEQVIGSPFQAISNLYGTNERTRYLFRDTLAKVQALIEIKNDPGKLLSQPFKSLGSAFTALHALPQRRHFRKPILYGQTSIDQLPQIKSWPMDGGAFITMPQVCTEDPEQRGVMHSNVGMYRIQLSGNDYIPNKEIGLHYQIHRGIGVHHEKYKSLQKPFPVSIFVGGGPAAAFAAIMPLPEGMSELTFAGMLGGRRFGYFRQNDFLMAADADFVITGYVKENVMKAEGPFGDHLGYYSLAHDFPVMEVTGVYHRKDPLWHFTVVGRPPAEDSSFGWLIHEIVRDLTPIEFPGLVEIHAVDAAGVHPLLLAIGQERYMPFREQRPEEILTISNRILGSGQTSLAKFLIIAAQQGTQMPSTHDIPAFLQHVLKRVDWRRDLHFQTQTTIDTLDYSGDGWNAGSKLVIAACGPELRSLNSNVPSGLVLSAPFSNPQLWQAGVLVIQMEPYSASTVEQAKIQEFARSIASFDWTGIPLIVLVDDSQFTVATTNNFVWVTFTRSNPSHDVYGVDEFIEHKHWGCNGPLIIDARIKPHHAPVLEVDPAVSRKVDGMFGRGGELEFLSQK